MKNYVVTKAVKEHDPFNHGKPWTNEHLRSLCIGFVEGVNASVLAVSLGRKVDAVLAKLCDFGLLRSMDTYSQVIQYQEPETLERAIRRLYAKLKLVIDEPCRRLSYVCCDMQVGPYYEIAVDPEVPVQSETPTNQEQNMIAPIIETKTFIAGVDATNMSDAQIFDKIATLEASIAKWDKVQNKPKKLSKMIEDLQEDIKKLVDYVDGR